MKALVAMLAAMTASPTGAAAPTADPPGCHAAAFEGSRFTVCPYRAGVDELRLASRGPAGPIGSLGALRAQLGDEATRVAFAMNAGMYDPAQAPLGLFVAGGRTLRPLNRATGAGNFFLLPNGVFWVGT